MINSYPLYEKSAPYILGFHGCDQSVAEVLLATETPTFKPSTNIYDWLGNGMYFWENDPNRAYSYIKEVQKRNPERIINPVVIGAVLDLGYCLNLVENRYITLVQDTYKQLQEASKRFKFILPSNKEAYPSDHDKLLRPLDCAVIEFLHQANSGQAFDSVRGMFIEGGQLYNGAGFHEKTHVQIAIRNPNMIKGYFKPLLKHERID